MKRATISIAVSTTLFGLVTGSAAFQANAQDATSTQEDTTTLGAVQVTGSRIPRAQIEGPAPITVMTAEEIQSAGLVSVPDILRTMTQNGGETGVELLMLQGQPIGEPVVQRGPFVMNTKQQINEAIRDYQTTQFGGWSWASTEPVHPRKTP